MMPKMILTSSIIVVLLLTSVNAKIIQVQNPGNNNDIQPAINTALNSAADSDTLSIPEGTFVFNKNIVVNKFISFKGAGIGKTILYRAESVSDTVLSNNSAWDGMLKFSINKSISSNITVYDITFKSKKPCVVAGDGGSLASDIGIRIVNCIDFVITRCRFEYFGNAAVSVAHTDTLASGLICKNEFYHNMKGPDGLGLGYGVVVYGANKQWIANPRLGSKYFIFIEDNTFDIHRHAIAAGGCGLYVARHNTFTNNLLQHTIDTHSAQGTPDANFYGTRAVEIYDNNLTNTTFKDGTPIVAGQPASRLNEVGILMRAGDAIIYNNTVVGYRFAVGISVYPDPGSPPYPMMSQPGYLSGLALGSGHSGTDPVSSDGDLFSYNNTFTPWVSPQSSSVFYNYYPSLFKEGRDYHLVPKPGYTPFVYPHPLNINTTSIKNDATIVNNPIHLEIYPNPNHGIMSIKVSGILGAKSIYTLEVKNVLGQVLYKSCFMGGYKKNLNLSACAKGIYFLSIKNEIYKVNRRLFVSK